MADLTGSGISSFLPPTAPVTPGAPSAPSGFGAFMPPQVAGAFGAAQQAAAQAPNNAGMNPVDSAINSFLPQNTPDQKDVSQAGLAQYGQEQTARAADVAAQHAQFYAGTDGRHDSSTQDPQDVSLNDGTGVTAQMKQLWDDAAAGLAQGVGGVGKFVAHAVGSKGLANLADEASKTGEAMMPDRATTADQVANFGGGAAMFLGGGDAVGGVGALLGLGTKLIRVLQIGTAATAGASMVGEQAYENAMQTTGNQDVAQAQSYKAFLSNLPVAYLTNKLGFFGDTGSMLSQVAKTAGMDAINGAVMQAEQNYFGYKPTGEGITDMASLSALFGAGAKGARVSLEGGHAPTSAPEDKDIVFNSKSIPTPDDLSSMVTQNPNAIALVSHTIDSMNQQDAQSAMSKLTPEAQAMVQKAMDMPAFLQAGAQVKTAFPEYAQNVAHALVPESFDPHPSSADNPAVPKAGTEVPNTGTPGVDDSSLEGKLSAVPTVDENGQPVTEQPAAVTTQAPRPTEIAGPTPAVDLSNPRQNLPDNDARAKAMFTELDNIVPYDKIDRSNIQVLDASKDSQFSKLSQVLKNAFGIDTLLISAKGPLQTQSGKVIQDQVFNGMSLRGSKTIVINKAANGSMLNVIGHELSHQLRQQAPEIWNEMANVAQQRANTGEGRRLAINLQHASQDEGGRQMTADAIKDEHVAEIVGEQMQDPQFFSDVASIQNQGWIAKAKDAIGGLLDKWTNAMMTGRFVRGAQDIQAVREAVKKGFSKWENLTDASRRVLDASRPASGESTLDTINRTTDGTQTERQIPAGATPDTTGMRKSAARDAVAADQGESAKVGYGIDPDKLVTPESTAYTDMAAGRAPVVDPKIPYTHEELVGFGREEDPNAIDHTDHAEVERQKDAMANEGGPNFKRAAREDGETDKQYAKRVIDKGPMPEGKLKDDPNLYFNKGDLVDLDKLHATKPPEDNTDNAIKRMAAASEGALSKRDPISIAPRPGDPGNFDVVDGNGTLSAAKAAGFKQLPTKIDTRSEEMAEQISNGKKVSLEEANEVNPRLASSLESLRTRMQQASKVKEKFDTAVERISDMVGGTTQLAPIKGEARAFAKTWYDNRGDASVIKDLVRGTVVVHTPDAVKEVVSEIKRQFPDTVVKRNTYETEPKEDGYRDALVYVDIGGMKCELQVNIPEMMAAKKENHGLYEQVSALDRKYSDKMMPAAERSRRGDMIAAQRQSYDAAYALALRARSESTSLAKSSKDSSVVVTDRNVSYRKGAGSPDGESQRAGLKSGPDSRIPNLGSQETGTSSQSKNSVVGEKSERLTDTGASPVNTEQDHSTTLFKRNGRDDAQMAWEATPGESTGVLPGIHDAPIEQKMEYLRAVSEALTDKKGNDLIAKALGVPEGETLFGVSAWDGRTGAGARTNLPVGVLKSGKVAKSARDMLNAYSAMRGIAMRQEAVVWHKPMYDSSLRAANGVDINLPRALTEPEFTALYKGLIDRFGTSEIAPGYTGKGAVLLNFTDIPNPEFHAGVKDVLDKLPDEWGGGPYELKKFRSDGDYISNDWKENPNGEGFRSWLGGTERPDLWARATSLQARVDAVNGEFGSKYGWDKPAQAESAGSDASARATGAEKPVQGEQESGVVPEARFSRQLIEDTIEGKQKGPIAFLDSTPDKLKKAGLPDLPIAATAQVIQKIASGKNGARAALSSHDIFDLQNHLKNPLAVFKSDSVKGDFVVLTKMIKDGKPVAVTLTPDGRMMSARINVLTSAYGKDAGSISDWVKKGNMVSVDRRGFEDLPVPVQAQLRSMVDDAAPRFSRDKDTIGERFTLGGQSNKDGAQTALQDRFLRMKQVQDDVEAQGGKVDHMTGNDVYRTEERYHGTVAAKVGDFSKYTVQPLVRDMAKAGVSMDDVALYMYAKHAEERNDRIADINPMMPDGGSGMTTEEANKILADYATDPKIDAIRDFADRFQAITEATRQELVKGGLVDPETLAKWNQSYKNYVPLKGFENVDELGNLTRNNAGGRGSGKGFSIDGDESRRALGRSTKAGDILENIINDHERAIQRSEKNKVAKALLDFVTDNPDKKLWQVNRVVSKPYFLKSRLPPTPGQLMDGQVAYRKETVKDPERTVTAKVGGKEYHITLGDQKLADAFLKQRGVLNMDSQEVAKAMKVWVGVNRGLARLYTSLNPAFVMTNFLKHYTVGMLHGSTAMGPKLGLQIGRDTFPAAAGIFAEERGAQPSVVPATGPKTWGQWYQQYKADGGRTGFYIFDDIDAKKERLNGLYREAGGSGMSTPLSTIGAHGFAAVHALSHLVEDANGSVENAVRLAAYKNAVEGGMSRAEASSMAKNLVANFNRRGTWTPVVGSAFLFFNPAVQHITRIGQAARESPKTWTSLVASMVGAGIYLGLRNAQDTDEDGVPYWDKDVSSYEKEKNFVISLGGGKRVTIPTPYEYGAFVHMGYAISDMMRGHSLSDKTAEIAGSFLEHFNPINSGSTGITRLVPSAFAPIAQYAANQNYQGNPLMPDAGPNNLPDSERYWGSTRGSLVQEFTSWLNSVTGGDKAVPGKISVSPEVVKNTLAGYTGGMGTFVANTMETLSTLMGGQGLSAAIDKGQVPFAAQVLKTDTLHGEEQYFRVASGQAERSLAEMKQYYNSDNPAILDRIQKNNGIAALANSVAEVNRAMGSLRKQDNMIVDDPDMSQSEKDAAHKEIDAQRQQLLSTWNNQFYRAQQEKEQQ